MHLVEGQVQGLQVRSEQQSSKTIWNFRLERYDQSGRRVMLVPVEMRGYAFEGSIHDGDWARARGKSKAGTFQAREVENLTTGAGVRAKGISKIEKVGIAFFVLFFCALILWGILDSMYGG